MTRKKPWNRVNLPLYSISSSLNGQHNMNIITYVTAISMHPKRFACCIYHHTMTLDNVQGNGRFVLQLLSNKQYPLVALLGRTSGKKTDKMAILGKRKKLDNWKGMPILKECLAVMELQTISRLDGGDHDVFICDLVSWKNMQDGEPLTLALLREKKLIRI